MSTSGQWEVVKNAKRKNVQTTSNKLTKGQKKKLIENMPRVEQAGPIKETQTIYEAFLEQDVGKQETYSSKKESSPKANGTPTAKKSNLQQQQQQQQQQQKKKTPEKTKDGAKPNDNQQVSQVTCEELESLLVAVQTRFPDTPSIWLKDLASYLDVKLTIDNSDPVFSGKPPGYPTCILSSGIHKLLTRTLSQCTPQTLQLFFEHCLNSMVQYLNKGIPFIGEYIFLQCLAEEKPEIILNNIPKLVDLRNSYQNRHAIGMSILWTAGQVGLSNLKAGLEVWLKLMLPVLGVKAFSKYVVDYVDALLKFHPNSKSASEVLGVREFFPIVDLVHSPMGLHSTVQKQLQSIYPKLKTLSYGTNPESTLHNFFPSYLARLQSIMPPSYREELLSSLVECLTRDKHTYSVWRQLYTKHLTQSSMLLEHILRNWDKFPSKFPRKLLEETLHTFQVTNEELGSLGKTGAEGYAECVSHSSDLLAKMSVWRFPWRLLIFFAVLATTFGVAYDINKHGSFKESQIGRFFKDIGMLAVCEQAWAKITVYSDKSYRWLNKNVPVYFSQLQRFLSPYVQQFWHSVLLFAAYVWESTQGLRDWFNLNAPLALHWANDNLPVYVDFVLKLLREWALVLQSQLQWLWALCLQYAALTARWFQEHVFTGDWSPENLQRYAGQFLESVQLYAKSAYHRVVQMISGAS